MRVEHLLPCLGVVTCGECFGEDRDSLVLGHDMTGSSPQHGVVEILDGVERSNPQRPDNFLCRLALGTTVCVFGVDEFSMLPRVHDHDLDVIGDEVRGDLERVAIDQERMTGDPRGDRQLIHDAARHTGRTMLRSLAKHRTFDGEPSWPSMSAAATCTAALEERPATGKSDDS